MTIVRVLAPFAFFQDISLTHYIEIFAKQGQVTYFENKDILIMHERIKGERKRNRGIPIIINQRAEIIEWILGNIWRICCVYNDFLYPIAKARKFHRCCRRGIKAIIGACACRISSLSKHP
jgi:hypothetical protein